MTAPDKPETETAFFEGGPLDGEIREVSDQNLQIMRHDRDTGVRWLGTYGPSPRSHVVPETGDTVRVWVFDMWVPYLHDFSCVSC